MDHREALRVLAEHRGDRVVITTMASIHYWSEFSDTPLDFAYMPSSMGQAPALGLGLALAHPERGLIVVNGDGSMLMNLGSLATLATYSANVFVVIMDNQMYEITGGQPVVGAGRIDFVALGRSMGIGRVCKFETIVDWEKGAPEALAGKGPALIWLKIDGQMGQKTPRPPRPMAEQLQRLAQALHGGRNPVSA